MSCVISFVSSNPNKLSEFLKIVGDEYSKKVRMLICNKFLKFTSVSLDLPELQGSIEEIATQKCLAAAKLVNGPVLVEDTSLCFKALNGMPGPFVKWFLKSVGPDGLPLMLKGFNDYRADAVCTFGYCEGCNKSVKLFAGITSGQIVSPRGPQTFGWDCVFQPDGFDQTYAEMDKSVKNSISHRYKALEAVKSYMIEHIF